MKKIFNFVVFTILFSIYLPANILIPVTADAKAEKSVLRPGETVKITLLNFRDENNKPASSGEKIIVRSSHGLIMNGTSWSYDETGSDEETSSIPTVPITGSAKVFLLGSDGRIEVYYRAPLRGKVSEVEIEVFNSPSYGSTAVKEFDEATIGKLIAKAKLKIKWGTYFLLNYEEKKKNKRGSKVVYTHEIKSVIRIDCEPWQAGSMLQIKNLEVLEFSGKADLIGNDYHEVQKAVSAKPLAYNTLVLLHLNPENKKIQGIIYEPVPLNVEWQGDEIPEGPPDVVNVGPVSKDERGSEEARFQGYKMKFDFPKSKQDSKGKTEERVRSIQQFLLQNFAETQVHPDHIVKEGDGKTFFAGQGKWEKSSGSNFHRKTYTWELHITD